MFERFTDPSRTVIIEAEAVALEVGSPYLTAAHLLYGCAEGRDETAGKPLRDCGITPTLIRRRLPRTEQQPTVDIDPQALSAIGIDYAGVQAAVEDTFGPGALQTAPDRRVPPAKTRKPRFTPEAKRSLQLALRAALELHHKQIMPGHILLGLLRLDNDLITSGIADADTTVAELSAAVFTQLAIAA